MNWKSFEPTFKEMTHRKWWQFWRSRWSETPGQTMWYRQKGKVVEVRRTYPNEPKE